MTYERFEKESCIIHVIDKKDVHAWTNNGGTAYYIRPSEKDMFRFDPERALNHMLHKVRKGINRCSSCGWEGTESEFTKCGFADILCVACIEEKKQKIEDDIKSGNICRFCKKPRTICTC